MIGKPNYLKQWSEIIADLIKEQGWSERGFAIHAGVSRSLVRKVIHQKCKDVRVSNLEKIMCALGYEIDAFPMQKEAS